ncbi:Atxe2 family lasso peptide isopeptidase [Hyphococcus sp.]|uniref:Atxe2 family lasso peptide isopeptidase n=2 Tax=Hyphococcus sp. TaxID=2038636 RepID=UPI0035C6C5E7
MLVETADFTGLAASPDGRFAAFRVHRASVESNSYSSSWYVVATGGDSAPVRIGDGGAPLKRGGYPVVETPRWSADSRWIYFRALREDGVQIWRAPIEGGEAERITDDDADIITFELIGDERLVYETGADREAIARAEREEYDRGVLIDGSVPVGRPLFRSGFINGRLASERYNGQWLLTGGLLADAPRRYKTIDPHGQTREATKNEIALFERARHGGAPALAEKTRLRGFQAGQDGIAFRSDDGMALKAWPGGDSSLEIACPADSCASVSWFAWAPGGKAIIFASRDHARTGAQSLFVWDLEKNAVRLILASDGGLHGGAYFHPDSRCAVTQDAAICVAAEANSPPRLERIDLETGARRVMFHPNEALARASGPPAELLTWRSAEGIAFSGRFLPAAGLAPDARAPLFITYYLCAGYLRGGMGDEWPLAALAAAGVSVLCIHKPSGESVLATEDYRSALSGIEAAIDILAARNIDRTRVGMGGFSFGAEIIAWTAMNSDLLAAGSLASPTLSESYFWRRALIGEPFETSLRTRWELGAPHETPAQWRKIGLQHNLDRVRLPLLMQFPEEEYLASIDYFAPLMRRKAPVEMHVFPHEPHYKFLPRHKRAVYERNLDWFRFWLQDYVDPAPDKADQYRRWKALRKLQAARP